MNSILNFRAGHLSNRQVDDQLIGDLAPQPAAHLAGCALCARRVAEAEAPIASFRAMALEWSERRSATMPLQAAATSKPRMVQRFAFGTVTAALLTIALAIPAFRAPAHQQGGRAASSVAVPTVAPVEAATQAPVPAPPVVSRVKPAGQPAAANTAISRDNEMLQEIDVALSTPSASPASLGLEMVSSEQSRPQYKPAVLQD